MIIAIIVISAIVILALVVTYIYLYTSNKLLTSIARGLRIYKVDIERKLVQRHEHEKIRSIQALRSSYAFSNDWEQIEYLRMWLRGSDGEPLLRKALIELEKKPKEYSFEFTSQLPSVKKMHNVKFKVVFNFYLSDGGLYLLVVKWETVLKQKVNEHIEAKIITRSELDSTKMKATGYIAFNVKKNYDATTRLLRIASAIWHKQIIYFFASGLLILVFQDESVRLLSTKMKQFIADFEKRGIQQGAQQLYDGSSYIYASGAHVTENQNRCLQALEFFVSISIDNKKNFVSLANKELNLEDYKMFSEGLRIFKTAIRERDIVINTIPVKRYGTNRKITEFIQPAVKGLSPHITDTILRNFNNKQELIDATASKIATMHSPEPVLVDITETWLVSNKDQLKNKKAIYVVDLEDRVEVEKIRQIIEELEAKGLVFGLKLSVFDEKSSILIKRIKPNFVIIDKSFMGDAGFFDSNTYISLLTISELAKQEGIRIIYEKPSEFFDNFIVEKIGLQYYY